MVAYAAVASVFRDTTVGRVDVAGGKQVCYSEQGSFVASCQRPVVRIAITQVGRNIKIVELLVDVQHKVGILLTVFVIAVIIQTFLSFGKFLIGSSINLTFKLNVSIVHTITSGKIHPVGDLIAQTYIKHITALLVRCDVAVSSPVGILRTVGCIGNRPILYRNIAALIITLESLDIVEVFSTGEKVGRNHRIPVLSLRYHVFIFLFHIGCA